MKKYKIKKESIWAIEEAEKARLLKRQGKSLEEIAKILNKKIEQVKKNRNKNRIIKNTIMRSLYYILISEIIESIEEEPLIGYVLPLHRV